MSGDLPCPRLEGDVGPGACNPRLRADPDAGVQACVLLVEDDPVARAFLSEVLGGLPLRLLVAGSAGEALQRCGEAPAGSIALALLDLQLPDGDGGGLLRALRARCDVARAVVLTADAGAVLDAGLVAAGFAAVVHKPLARGTLLGLVREWVPEVDAGCAEGVAEAVAGRCEPPGSGEALRVLDDQRALVAANGRAEIVASLRALLVADLDGQCATVRTALQAADTSAARAVLHRMTAASGFCGAMRLQSAVAALDRALARGEDHRAPLQAFEAACTATAAAIRAV